MMNKFSGSICFASLSIKSLVFSFLEATSLTAETFYLKKWIKSVTRVHVKSCFPLTAGYCCSPQLFLFQPPPRLLEARLVACGSHRLLPASHQPLPPSDPSSNFLHLLQESNWTPGFLLADKTRDELWLVGPGRKTTGRWRGREGCGGTGALRKGS